MKTKTIGVVLGMVPIEVLNRARSSIWFFYAPRQCRAHRIIPHATRTEVDKAIESWCKLYGHPNLGKTDVQSFEFLEAIEELIKLNRRLPS